MNGEELKNRTKQFAHRCVKLSAALPDTYLGNHVRGQLIRCSTSVASNYRATCLAQSKASFISKLSIVLEETDESYKRAHSPQLAAGLASESKNDKLPYGRRFPAACCRVLQSYFWLEFIIDENLLEKKVVEPLLKETSELTAIFISSRKTARKSDDKKNNKRSS